MTWLGLEVFFRMWLQCDLMSFRYLEKRMQHVYHILINCNPIADYLNLTMSKAQIILKANQMFCGNLFQQIFQMRSQSHLNSQKTNCPCLVFLYDKGKWIPAKMHILKPRRDRNFNRSENKMAVVKNWKCPPPPSACCQKVFLFWYLVWNGCQKLDMSLDISFFPLSPVRTWPSSSATSHSQKQRETYSHT